MLKRILPEELSSLIKRAKDITTYKAPSKNELSNKIAELSKANDITDKNENTIGKGLAQIVCCQAICQGFVRLAT